mgnify:FL=1
METVRIYIETSFRGPAVKDGKYAAALVITKHGRDSSRIVSGEESETTFNRCTLMAIIKALQRMTRKCHIIIYTDNSYVKNMVEQGNPEKWRRSEWKKAAGTEVQNKELWKLFLEEKDKQELEVRFCQTNEYKETLQAVIHGEEFEGV